MIVRFPEHVSAEITTLCQASCYWCFDALWTFDWSLWYISLHTQMISTLKFSCKMNMYYDILHYLYTLIFFCFRWVIWNSALNQVSYWLLRKPQLAIYVHWHILAYTVFVIKCPPQYNFNANLFHGMYKIYVHYNDGVLDKAYRK